MNKLLFYIIILLTFFGCKRIGNHSEGRPIARVYDKYLYSSDLKNAIPSNISLSDSTELARDFIDKWVRKQLLLRKAELNLTEEDKNLEKQIENYKTSLLIFKYEQNHIKQKLDTIINHREIEEYYNQYPSNFILNNNIVKALFLQIPRSSPQIYNVRRWYKSDSDESLKKLESYAFQYATEYEYFNDDWIDFTEIEKRLPVKIDNPDRYLRYRKYIDLKDSTYYYFLNIKDYKLIGTVAPLSYIEEDIQAIMMTKRKIQLINKLESDIYNDALNRGYFTIF